MARTPEIPQFDEAGSAGEQEPFGGGINKPEPQPPRVSNEPLGDGIVLDNTTRAHEHGLACDPSMEGLTPKGVQLVRAIVRMEARLILRDFFRHREEFYKRRGADADPQA